MQLTPRGLLGSLVVGSMVALAIAPAAGASSVVVESAPSSAWGPVEHVAAGRAVTTDASFDGDLAALTFRADGPKIARKSSGEAWKQARRVLPRGAGYPFPSTFVGTADGWTYAWEEVAAGSRRILTRSFTDRGPGGPVVVVDDHAEVTFSSSFWIEPSADGGAAIARIIQAGGTTFYPILHMSDGDTWTKLPRLPAGVAASYSVPAFGLDPSGHVTYVAAQFRGTPEARVVALASDGGSWTAAQIGPRAGFRLEEVYAGDAGPGGDLVTSWEEVNEETGERALLVATHAGSDPLEDWDVRVLEAEDVDCSSRCVRVVMDALGHATTAWAGPRTGSTIDVRIVQHDGDSWGTARTLLTDVPNRFTQSTELDAAASGHVVFSWPASDDGSSRVFRCSPAGAVTCAEAPLLEWPDAPYGSSYQVTPGVDGEVIATRRLRPGHGSDTSVIQSKTLAADAGR